MSGLRVGVEWSFGKIVVRSAYVGFGRAMRVQESPVRKYYHVSVLLANAHTCFYGATQTSAFDCPPPDISEYFGVYMVRSRNLFCLTVCLSLSVCVSDLLLFVKFVVSKYIVLY